MSADVAAIHANAPAPLELARALGLTLAARSRKSRKGVTVICPVHADDNPSCDIVRRDGRVVWLCRSCNEGGDLLDLVAAVNRIDMRRGFHRVLELAAELVGVDLAKPEPQRRRRRVEPKVLLARAIDCAADDYRRRGTVKPSARIERATVAELEEAFEVLAAADAEIASELADQLERADQAKAWLADHSDEVIEELAFDVLTTIAARESEWLTP